ncbi:hypothetical protein BC835DRAFT_1435017 [Cytidiella melzeri]|nr:hypothetical protein BC835DRAFT_1435017 [Cytidiella melzeri]
MHQAPVTPPRSLVLYSTLACPFILDRPSTQPPAPSVFQRMPPVFSALHNLPLEHHCRKCDRDGILDLPHLWDSARKIIPYPATSFHASPGHPPHTRCIRCRRREQCTNCRKIFRKKHFQKPSKPNETGADAFFKTCSKCREKNVQRRLRCRQQAIDAGLRYCPSCNKNVTEADCQGTNGTLYITCNACREVQRVARARVAPQPMLQNPHYRADNNIVLPIDGELLPEGLEVVEPDEFDAVFSDGIDYMNIDVPQEHALSSSESSLLT